MTQEWDAAEPAARQLKYYARGVGNFRVGWRGRDGEQEVLSLVNLTRLSPQALAAASAEARRLERLSYRTQQGPVRPHAPAERAAATAPTPSP